MRMRNRVGSARALKRSGLRESSRGPQHAAAWRGVEGEAVLEELEGLLAPVHHQRAPLVAALPAEVGEGHEVVDTAQRRELAGHVPLPDEGRRIAGP